MNISVIHNMVSEPIFRVRVLLSSPLFLALHACSTSRVLRFVSVLCLEQTFAASRSCRRLLHSRRRLYDLLGHHRLLLHL
jgi:hypothetical protein